MTIKILLQRSYWLFFSGPRVFNLLVVLRHSTIVIQRLSSRPWLHSCHHRVLMPRGALRAGATRLRRGTRKARLVRHLHRGVLRTPPRRRIPRANGHQRLRPQVSAQRPALRRNANPPWPLRSSELCTHPHATMPPACCLATQRSDGPNFLDHQSCTTRQVASKHAEHIGGGRTRLRCGEGGSIATGAAPQCTGALRW